MIRRSKAIESFFT